MLLVSNCHFEQVKACGPPILSLLEQGPKVWDFYSIEPFAKLRFSFKIKACEKFYHRHMIDIPRI